jgi:hypothetical protein
VAGRCRTAAELKAWLRPWGPVIEATWDEYRDILAASLDPHRWSTVEKAVSLTRQIESIVAKAERAESPVVAFSAAAPRLHWLPRPSRVSPESEPRHDVRSTLSPI